MPSSWTVVLMVSYKPPFRMLILVVIRGVIYAMLAGPTSVSLNGQQVVRKVSAMNIMWDYYVCVIVLGFYVIYVVVLSLLRSSAN